eukprot:comp19333_c0_seq1/m.36438 comp19333_c0_seq1/g.36438  ORF comp19333_c0_seq1/g.36438 comp19333_c0_seq1/m.36438 type:complete len:309 (+) comp19333_c0_seq1:538-1464(+)
MEAEAVDFVPLGPDVWVFAHCAVARAWHVGEHAIKLHALALSRGRCALLIERRVHLALVACDDENRGHAATQGLVAKQVAALVVGVVGDNESLGLSVARRRGHCVDDLAGLGPRGGTHVDHTESVVGLEEQHGDHGHFLLSRNHALRCAAHEPALEFLQLRVLAQIVAVDVEAPCLALRIPRNGARRVHCHFDAVLLADIDAVKRLEPRALKLVDCAKRFAALKPEGGRKRLAHRCHKVLPLALGDDVSAVVVVERVREECELVRELVRSAVCEAELVVRAVGMVVVLVAIALLPIRHFPVSASLAHF